MADDSVERETVGKSCRRSVRRTPVNSYVVQRNAKLELREKVKKVTEILKKSEHERTPAEKALVKKHPEIVKTSQKNAQRLQATKDRVLEIEDEPQVLDQKCDQLAELIRCADRIVVYTGAGISTAASIPDYRGPNGVWTLLKKGQEPSAQDLSDAEPTFTHMSITKLFRAGLVKHIVSQNCDGLHIRSGYPRYALSEVHGNMYIECCYSCNPHKEYIRLFDVTERTGVRRHTTGRRCRTCGSLLTDTIVHFGEKGKIKSPYRWKEAVRAAKNSDLILCLGSSLKILRRYTCLWAMDRKPHQRPKLVIVNLQWTPKDDGATLKINGRCDYVMKRVMKELDYEVPEYKRDTDPIFKMCTPLRASELKTTSKKILIPPFLPDKIPGKTSKKSRQKKSRSSRSHVKRGKCSTSSSSEAQNIGDVMDIKKVRDSSKDDNLSFSDLPKKCEMKADWDTPIFALDPPLPTAKEEYVREDPDKICDHSIELCTSFKEDIPDDKGLCHMKVEIEPSSHIDTDTTIKSEPPVICKGIEKDNVNAGNFSLKSYEVIDLILVDENEENVTNVYQLDLDGIKSSSTLACDIPSSCEMKRNFKEENCKADGSSECFLSHFSDVFHTAENTEKNAQLTQPVPGTVVINLEVVDEEALDDFATGKSESAQIGMSLDNVLLINLDSDHINDVVNGQNEICAQNIFCKDTNSIQIESNGPLLQELMNSSTDLNAKQQPQSMFNSLEQSHKNNADIRLAEHPSLPLPVPFKSPLCSPSRTSLNCAEILDPLPALPTVSTSSKHFTSPPFLGKPMSLPYQQQVLQHYPELPLQKHQSSPSNESLLKNSLLSTPSAAGMLNSCTASSINVFSSGIKTSSKSLSSYIEPELSLSVPCKKGGQISTINHKDHARNHENLLQLLNKPVSLMKHTSDIVSTWSAAKNVISTSGLVNEKDHDFTVLDKPYSLLEKLKRPFENRFSTLSPFKVKCHGQENVKTDINHEMNLDSKSKKINFTESSLTYVTQYGGKIDEKLVPLVNNSSRTTNPLSFVRSGEEPNHLKTTAIKSGNANSVASNHMNTKTESVPLCVLNMDDILNPKVEERLLVKTNTKTTEIVDTSQINFLQQGEERHTSTSPFPAISLITSLASVFDEAAQTHTIDEGVSISDTMTSDTAMVKPSMVSNSIESQETKILGSMCENTKEVIDLCRNPVSKETQLHKFKEKVSVGIVNNAGFLNAPITSESVKPVFLSSPVQNEKINNKSGTKSRKRPGRPPVIKTAYNTKIKKTVSESAPGWFGKGLSIKFKRKRKA